MRTKIIYLQLSFIFLIALSNISFAKGVYLEPKDFVARVFAEKKPEASALWLSHEQKQYVTQILGHNYAKSRIKYWQKADETVWVLQEIGKEKPITVGFHIGNERIQQVRVLVYRESRGDEVRHSFFTDQFMQAKLDGKQQLDRHIDGITGATLSVRALTKLSRLALWLTTQVDDSSS